MTSFLTLVALWCGVPDATVGRTAGQVDRCRVFLVDCVNMNPFRSEIVSVEAAQCFRQASAKLEAK